MKQLLFIHGGNVYQNYDVYLTSLLNKEFELERFLTKNWKNTLEDELPDFQIIKPTFPNGYNAQFYEWQIYFEKVINILEIPNLIIIGHSLGAIFMAKWLSVNKNFPFKAVLMIAGPHSSNSADDYLGGFEINSNELKSVADQSNKLYFWHSNDDPIVPVAEFMKYKSDLPKANYRSFNDKQHFNQSEFPELIDFIKSL